jgi:hypothetical protein
LLPRQHDVPSSWAFLAAAGRSARMRIVRQFSMDANADRWEALYRKLLAR